MAPTGTPNEIPGDRAGRPGPARLVALVAGGLALAGCGGEQFVSNQAVGPVSTSVTTTTASSTTTTTTIDFDRPVVQADTPLDREAGPAEVADLVAEIRGQSADVDAQIRRLAPFPDLDGPAVAQILDLAVSLAPATGDDVYPSAARVRYRVPDAAAGAAKDLSDELRSLGWFKADESQRATDEGSVTEAVFRVPGRPAEDVELRAAVEELPGVTIVDLEYAVDADEAGAAPRDGSGEAGAVEEGATYVERLSAWQEELPLPRAATLVEVAVETAPDRGTLVARYLLPADDEAEAVRAVVRSIGSGGYQLDGDPSGESPATGPIDLVDEELGVVVEVAFTPSSDGDTFEIVATSAFDLDPLP